MKRQVKRWPTSSLHGLELLKPLADALKNFWVAGLVLLILMVGNWFLHPGTERYDWTQYLLLGLVSPLLLLICYFLRSWQFFQIITLGLGCLFLIVAASFIKINIYILLLVIVQVILSTQLVWETENTFVFRISFVILSALISSFLWTVATRMVWWQSYTAWLYEHTYRILMFFATFALVSFCLHSNKYAVQKQYRRIFLKADCIFACLVLGLASLRTGTLFYSVSLHHWGVVVGPAELVRQGGWLLWDVPAQYGFLSTLLIAYLPFASVWRSFYIANALLLCISASFLFLFLRSLFPGFTGWLFALSITIASVFLIPGDPSGIVSGPALSGPFITPMVGAYRFFWCYVLIALLVWFRTAPLTRQSVQRVLLIGTGVWLIGVFWSFESAIYCSTIWFLAYTLLFWYYIEIATSVKKSIVYKCTVYLILPLLSVGIVILFITGYYFARLGHGPDWTSFFEYAFSFSSGFAALPINPTGVVLVLVTAFMLLLTVAVPILLGNNDHRFRDLVLAVGTLGGLWSASSYFVGRSHEVNGTNLMPIVLLAIGVVLCLLHDHKPNASSAVLIKSSIVPVMTIILTIACGTVEGLERYIVSPQVSYTYIDTMVPPISDQMSSLLQRAEVQRSDPIVFLENNFGEAQFVEGANGGQVIDIHRSWLPIFPGALLLPLSDARKATYVARYTAQLRDSGWLIWPRNAGIPMWLYEQLSTNYIPTKAFASADYGATYYSFVNRSVAGMVGKRGQSWSLESDLATALPSLNPQSANGMPNTWYFLDSTPPAANPQGYTLLTAEAQSAQSVPGFLRWIGPDYASSAGVNTTAAPIAFLTFSWPAHAVVVHPGVTHPIVVGWRSPVQGTIAIQGRLSDIDTTGGDGVAWSLAKNATLLASGRLANGASEAFGNGNTGSAVAATVKQNDFIYIIVAPNKDNFYDSTRLELTITVQ